jgi:uncharacterized protein (DUF2345 family)
LSTVVGPQSLKYAPRSSSKPARGAKQAHIEVAAPSGIVLAATENPITFSANDCLDKVANYFKKEKQIMTKQLNSKNKK